MDKAIVLSLFPLLLLHDAMQSDPVQARIVRPPITCRPHHRLIHINPKVFQLDLQGKRLHMV